MTGLAETPYAETEALLAVMNGDPERAEKILDGFLPNELITFDDQVTFLADLLARVERRNNRRRLTVEVDPMTAAQLTQADRTKTWAGTRDLRR